MEDHHVINLERVVLVLLKLAVAGEIRSGKDSFCDYILAKNPDMAKLYFAEGIKEVIQTCFPEELSKGKPRKLYQEIGTYMRTIDTEVWIKHLERTYQWHSQYISNFIVTDLRQPNEYEWLKANGFIVVKVESDIELRIERMKASGDTFNTTSLHHPVELRIKELPYDYLVTNNDTLESLYEQADWILQELVGEK